MKLMRKECMYMLLKNVFLGLLLVFQRWKKKFNVYFIIIKEKKMAKK